MRALNRFNLLIILALFIFCQAAVRAEEGTPIQKANAETMSAGIGHFARSRSLIIAAVREFDEGLKVVNPDALLDVAKFRADLIDRAKELERVLDPQPRVSRGGATYKPDSRLVGQKNKKAGAIK